MRFSGLVFRAHHPGWAHQPLSGDGARQWGGRFNPPGMAALYTSLRFETAWLEAQQGFAFKAQPMTLCAYRVDCAHVLDLTDAATLTALDIDAATLACPWEGLLSRRAPVPSHDLAKRLAAQRTAGIIVPSHAAGATPRDRNLVFWRWGKAPHSLTLIDDYQRLAT
ncbi:RES domain-containing protein [Sandaracinobacteroides saxicola]|uniref:RES domain-containing protein n=1 Tax=Sandaracinobacteroides saxicola TaxID=2759707 RepID=A0A7G5IMY2_9SPHN|nr:RES domain-containing protein [Sandaracinobacteroides saxicola]